MALFTDSDHVTAADLVMLDAEVADVAEANKLTLEGAGSIIRSAWQECGDRLQAQFQHYGSSGWYCSNTLPDWPTGNTLPSIRLSSIVVDGLVSTWMRFAALEVLFRSVANASQQDRYKNKQQAYAAEAASAWRRLSRSGLPLVSQPLQAPGGIHEPGVGAFRDQDVSSIESGSRTQQSVNVVITYWDAVRSAESGASRIVSFIVPDNNLLVVSRSGCNPPAAATHWNVYAGETGELLSRQNVSPIAIATTTWTAAGSVAASDSALGAGQALDRRLAFSNFLQRA